MDSSVPLQQQFDVQGSRTAIPWPPSVGPRGRRDAKASHIGIDVGRQMDLGASQSSEAWQGYDMRIAVMTASFYRLAQRL